MPALKPLFNKVAGLKASNFIKETPTQVFSCDRKIFKNAYLEEHLQTATSVKIFEVLFSLVIFFNPLEVTVSKETPQLICCAHVL